MITFPLPWRVDYRRLPTWHEKSSPYIVDCDGNFILSLPQFVSHPGMYDETANRLAAIIIDSVNGNIPK